MQTEVEGRISHLFSLMQLGSKRERGKTVGMRVCLVLGAD